MRLPFLILTTKPKGLNSFRHVFTGTSSVYFINKNYTLKIILVILFWCDLNTKIKKEMKINMVSLKCESW